MPLAASNAHISTLFHPLWKNVHEKKLSAGSANDHALQSFEVFL